MAKREDGKNSSDKEKHRKKMTAQEREELLVENFVGLQHAMTNLSIKFSALSENINKLLQIFEEAANKFSPEPEKKEVFKETDNELNRRTFKETDNELNKELIKKIDSLIDQNKTIAQGLIIMEEKLRSPPKEPPAPYKEDIMTRPRPRSLPNL